MLSTKPHNVVLRQDPNATLSGVQTHGVSWPFAVMSKVRAPDDVLKQCGLRLRALRHVLKLNQAEFAHILGASETQYQNWEGGARLPNALALARLEVMYGYPMSWVFAGALRHFSDFSMQRQLEEEAGRLGAVINGIVAEFPNQVPTTSDGRPSRQPARRAQPPRKGGTLHEGQKPIKPT